MQKEKKIAIVKLNMGIAIYLFALLSLMSLSTYIVYADNTTINGSTGGVLNYTIRLLSPNNGNQTYYARTPFFDWTDPMSSSEGFVIEIDDDSDFSSVYKTFTTSNSYFQFPEQLPAGTWYWRVEVIAGGTGKYTTPAYYLTVFEDFSFRINLDIADYESSELVKFNINAPLGSNVGVLITNSSGFDLSYNAPNLVQTLFTAILPTGNYKLVSNVTHFDKVATFTKDFSLAHSGTSNPVVNQTTNTTSNITNSSAHYTIKIFTKDNYARMLKDVQLQYRDIDSKLQINYSDDNGFIELDLLPYNYTFVARLMGYKTREISVNLNDHKTVTFALDVDEEVILEPSEIGMGLKIDNFDGGSLTPTDEFVFDYSINSSYELTKCQLLFMMSSGYSIKEEQTDMSETGKFSVTNIPSGDYKAKIKCFNNEENWDFSDEVSFSVDEPFVEENLVREYVSKIDELLNKIDLMQADELMLFSVLGVSENINNLRGELISLNLNYNELRKNKAAQTEIDSKKAAIESKIAEVNSALLSDISIKLIDDRMIYPESEGVKEIIQEYADNAELDITDRQKKKFVKENIPLQENFIIRAYVKLITLRKSDGTETAYTLIRKEVQMIEPKNGADKLNISNHYLLEYVPSEVISRGSPNFIKEGGGLVTGKIYKFDLEEVYIEFTESSPLMYYFPRELSASEVGKMRSIFVNKVNKESMPAITGFSVLADGVTGAFSSWGYLMLALLMGGLVMTFNPVYNFSDMAEKRRIYQLTETIHNALDHISKGDVKGSFKYYSSIMEGYNKVSPGYKAQLKDVMRYLKNEIDSYHFNQLYLQINELVTQGTNDPASRSLLNHLLSRIMGSYESMDGELQIKVSGKLSNLQLAVGMIKVKGESGGSLRGA